MTVLAFQTIRQRVAAQISALSGWTQSSWHLVQVQFAHRLTVDGQVSAYDAALSAELDLISAVLTLIDRHALHILWDGSSRSSLGEGWILVTVNFSAIHRI